MEQICPQCSAHYRDFHIGFTFTDVRQFLWSYSEDPTDWPNVTRRTVLGKWREMKLEAWNHHLDNCKGE